MLKVYNTLSRKKEIFVPRIGKNVKMFVCGQTVYDDAHLGHAKNYINYDIIVRYLRWKGYKVKYVQNITDVDDKIIKRARERGINALELSKFYIQRFFEDMENLRVKQSVNVYPKSSDYINTMIMQIKLLMKKKYAYKTSTGIYFDVAKFKDYTKLSGISLKELKKHRLEPDPEKKNVYDFSLWKFAKPGEISWKSPWGDGRPGWHIEDTAMTFALFGKQYDLHGGAKELIFPHHTNEIAQAEAAFDKKPFVKYWVHTGVLNAKPGEKMSKSMGNFITIREAIQKYDVDLLRFYFGSIKYSSDINFDCSLLENSKAGLEKIKNFYRALNNAKLGKVDLRKSLAKFRNDFEKAMDDDFNTPNAYAAIFNFISETNKVLGIGITDKSKKASIKFFDEVMEIFQFLDKEKTLASEKDLSGLGLTKKEILAKIEQRNKARKNKDFALADKIREELSQKGIILEDLDNKTKWKRA
jgi:cysteinyl-tRNA synthetase